MSNSFNLDNNLDSDNCLSCQNKINHRLYGEHSGFPPCCIKYWDSEWQIVPYEEKVKFFFEKRKIENRLNRPIYYIPCPTCTNNQDFVTVHFCGAECANFLMNQVGLPIEDVIDIILNNVVTGKAITPAGYRIIRYETIKEEE